MSFRAIRTGLARPGVIRPREKVSVFPTLARTPAQALAVEPRELWVALHLPRLAIEALGPPVSRNPETASLASKAVPRVIVELRGQTQYIVAVCEQAAWFGVRAGMSMAAGLALMPDLITLSRDPAREQQLLERLATRAHRFTPRVSLVPPDGLVLEVKGSLQLFGGAEALLQAIEVDCYEAGVKPLLALAPSPLAALAGARAGKPLLITQPVNLVGQVSALPLRTLRWPEEVLDRLKQIGVSNIGEALRLPRAGFARRFGKAQLAELDRLTGRDADLRRQFRVRERFRRKHELLHELEHHEAILNTLAPVLEELGAFLKARQCGITRLDCLLKHRHAPATRCVLRLAAPAANAKHFAKLLGEKLATLSLPEPVRACELRSGDLVSRAPAAEGLWQPGEHGGTVSTAASELIEHLRARLGNEAVYGLRVLESHRPETAWCAEDLLSPAKATSREVPWAAHRRPIWLLEKPEALEEQGGLPLRHRPLQLIEGPERIETGWWNGGDIARDYYVALDTRGVRLWVFRERTSPHRWFLQGVFG
jgi:protein ImuB